MRRSRKLAIAGGVLAVGITVAFLCHRPLRLNSSNPADAGRRPAPARLVGGPAMPVEVPEEQIELPRLLDQIESVDNEATGAEAESRERITVEPLFTTTDGTASAVDAWRPSTKSPPLNTQPLSPRVAESDETSDTANDDVARARAEPDAPHTDAMPIVHRVVKGDTLSSLAARYLGSSERFWDLFTANRDQLRNPDLLPVGIELRIPQAESAPRQEPQPLLDRPLAPLTGAAKRQR